MYFSIDATVWSLFPREWISRSIQEHLVQPPSAGADILLMVLFPSTPVQGDYSKPIVLFIGGAWLLMHAAWCSFMGDTEESYPGDSRVFLLHDRWGNELEDIGFDNKRLICTVAGIFLLACSAISFVHRHQAAAEPQAASTNSPNAG